MCAFELRENALGVEIHAGDQLLALYRATEELPRSESPKPCFAPLYTLSGQLVTEYRPPDHAWHTGLFFGWVHVNDANLWGGRWYLPETKKYEDVADSHGVQQHDGFTALEADGVTESLSWLDGRDQLMARESRSFGFYSTEGGYCLRISTRIEPTGDRLVMGASRAARYSGLVLRMGPSFAEADHYCSEGREGHANIMHQHARWVGARGKSGGFVALMDHPSNPRHPVTWFTRANLLGTGLLIEGDLELAAGECLELHHAFFVLDQDPGPTQVESLYADFAASPGELP